MSRLRLVIFDVDGTLVDSQHAIVLSMTAAHDRIGVALPPRNVLLSVVGLTLEIAAERLLPHAGTDERALWVQTYRDAYFRNRQELGSAQISPLFPGARELLTGLAAQPWTLLALATGKSRRGVDALIADHGLTGLFQSIQVADDHPSKPDPSMIRAALAETGVTADRAVMIGDTSYDMDMGRAAGTMTIGVGWGYHPLETLSADRRVSDFPALNRAIDECVEP